MKRIFNLSAAAVVACLVTPIGAQAKELTQDQVVKKMVGKPITARSFGVKINLRFEASGKLVAKSFIGNYTGKWVRGNGNQICSTFNSGPAKGTQCNTYRQTGSNKFRTSSGTRFIVH